MSFTHLLARRRRLVLARYVVADIDLSVQPKAVKPVSRMIRSAEINHRSAAMCLEGAVGASRHEPRTYVFPGDLYGQENV
jgi:hypothetical protein